MNDFLFLFLPLFIVFSVVFSLTRQIENIEKRKIIANEMRRILLTALVAIFVGSFLFSFNINQVMPIFALVFGTIISLRILKVKNS
jgi:uncharacterized membrane protein YedE/YeeE